MLANSYGVGAWGAGFVVPVPPFPLKSGATVSCEPLRAVSFSWQRQLLVRAATWVPLIPDILISVPGTLAAGREAPWYYI